MRTQIEPASMNALGSRTAPARRLVGRTGRLIVGILFTCVGVAGAQKLPWPNAGEDPIVTPVVGSSWLTHLGVTLRDTSLGQGAGRFGPGVDQREPRDESLGVSRSVELSGADLYRLNCQACHRREGTGAPPEIGSVLAPVQGASLAFGPQAPSAATRSVSRRCGPQRSEPSPWTCAHADAQGRTPHAPA